MVAHATIRHKLDLALQLINAVNGKGIEEYNAKFLTRHPGLKVISKPGGMYLFLNIAREEFEMEIHVYGYEPKKVQIRFPGEEENMPIREVYLLPLETLAKDEILTLRGNLPGIEEMEAVSLNDRNCCIKEFDAKRRIMSVLNQRNIRFHHTHYGLINREKTQYEHFQVEKEISPLEIICKEKLEKDFSINQPIVRVVFGQVDEDGNYVLKVAKEENTQYLVRYVLEGKVFYQRVNFQDGENSLRIQEIVHEEKEV